MAGVPAETTSMTEVLGMTLIWFLIWLIATLIGDTEALTFDPVNWWAGTLILAFAIDVNRPPVLPRRAD